MDLKRVAEVAAGECIRQGVGVSRLGSLLKAYANAHYYSTAGRLPDERVLLGPAGLAVMVEPENYGRYRSIPASFANGSFAIPAGNIPRAMESWSAAVADRSFMGGHPVDGLVKEFLDIHPFADGNGRLAWLIRAWLLGQWDKPEPLPDYYGKEGS